MRDVPRAPVTADGPAFGTYVGRFEDVDLRLSERGVGWLRRLLSGKRWQWFAAFDDAVAVGGAVVDAGLVGNVFLWVVDRESGELVADTDLVVPSPLVTVARRPASGLVASVDLPRRRLRIMRTDETVAVDAHFAGVDVALAASTADRQAVSAVCPVPGRANGVNVTQKETCVPFEGHVTVDRSYNIDGVGMLDYSRGLLARETEWRWAIGSCRSAEGRPVGFNLVSGFNDGLENAVWVDGEPETIGTATVEADGNAWHAETDCGTVDATLTVEGIREADLDVGIIASEYAQPLGAWSGTVAGHRVEGVGVAERHRARW